MPPASYARPAFEVRGPVERLEVRLPRAVSDC
jgi:hypothetical protein